MKTVIIGAGAMGSLFGGLLAESGGDVTLVDVWPEHVNALNGKGLEIEWRGANRTVRVRAASDPAEAGPADLVIVFVKSADTPAAAESAARVRNSDGLVLTLQNGLGNADVLAEAVPPACVLAGTTSHGATMLGPGRIRHAGSGHTVIGPWSGGDRSSADRTAEALNRAGIETEAVSDARALVWGKLLVNVGINAITALTNIKNGELLDLESTRALSRAAVEEAARVAEAQDIPVREDCVEHVLAVARATAENRSSMGQDVDNRRQTEIQAINGAVVREADRLGLEAPVNRTLTALVETLQAHYMD